MSASRASGSSSGASQTPTSPRARSASRRACHTASGTTAGPAGISAPSSRTTTVASSAIVPRLMSRGIDALLERLDADATHGVDEALVVVADVDVGFDEAGDDVGHLACRERRPDHLAERRVLALRAADRNLVPLRAVLVDAEHADVTDVMLAAGIHAAGHVEID